MVQGFDPNVPAPGPAQSAPVRTNFLALFTTNSGPSEPANPQLGTLWIDTSDSDNIKLKWYDGTGFITVIEHLESTPQVVGGTGTFVFTFSITDGKTLVIDHHLNKYPSVTVVMEQPGTDGRVVMPIDIVYNNANSVTVVLDEAINGKVYLN